MVYSQEGGSRDLFLQESRAHNSRDVFPVHDCFSEPPYNVIRSSCFCTDIIPTDFRSGLSDFSGAQNPIFCEEFVQPPDMKLCSQGRFRPRSH